jgi:GAF domain-containing protein
VALSVEGEAPDALCSILLLDQAGQRLTHGAAPSLPADYNAAIDGLAIGVDAGSCGRAAFLGRRVIVEDIQTDLLWADFKHLAAAAGLRACWSQPIRGATGEILGTFGIYHRDIRAPGADDIAFIESAAELAAIAIVRQREQEALALSESRGLRASQIQKETARNLTTFFEVSLDMLCDKRADNYLAGRQARLSQNLDAV